MERSPLHHFFTFKLSKLSSFRFVKRLSVKIKSINLSLLEYPPPSDEVTGEDICLFGSGGDNDGKAIIFCRDLPVGKRAVIGSWYLSPERHLFEFIIITLTSVAILHHIIPKLRHTIARPSYGSNVAVRTPLPLSIISQFFFILMILYKSVGYSGKLYLLLMPCNVNWTLVTILCNFPNLDYKISNMIYQTLVGWMGLVVVALVSADLSDLVMFMEIPYYYINHCILFIFPLHGLCTGRVSTLPSPKSGETVKEHFIKWWIFSCASFSLLYFTIATPLAIISGININYMLHPPLFPNLITGANYRLVFVGGLALLLLLVRGIVTLIEYTLRQQVLKLPFKMILDMKQTTKMIKD